ncbi:MAG: Glutamate decarboxylase-like protein [Ignavibacteria bacterium]|nr:MAG: Glutamate decarboxylase-like protein [Ignavibacteria bacterium]KAF0159114.1 MAG: Glutamate decarboxylase-like protein [Ignavibacteria bacterium]
MSDKKENLDMPLGEFREVGKKLVDWSADYLDNLETFDVLPKIKPGDVKSKLPQNAPQKSESFEEIINDLDKIILPGITHWQHPNFMAYFASTASGPGILADLISSALNVNGMIWRTSPALTELEQTVLVWYQKMLGIPNSFKGIVYDTASVSTLHAIASAREYLQAGIREKGMSGAPKLRLYCSEHAHNSIDKSCLTLGLGLDGIKKILSDENFSMIPEELENAIKDDRANGILPVCVVATIGTTSSTAVDPVDKIAEICERENIWLHVDMAYAGVTAMLPEMKTYFDRIEKADSIVSNPHKWLFVPIDFSTLYIRNPEVLKRAFSLSAEYLKTAEDSVAENYMDYGIQLGRRFRALKLWFVIRYFGVEGLQERVREHIRIAGLVAKWIDESENFERLAPTPFSTVCFRAKPKSISDENTLNELNEKLISEVNATGKVLLSHTKLNGKFTIRLVISGIRQEERHAEEVWKLLKETLKNII